ncbi:hypothetical protein [Sphingorhabdus sp. SMR4y]|uniref:hypothetical protein n=1 Tax=Sphingorhabdus sp. SMR4y TaxID=2584094 RepID=UPI000B600536|nr:hypothetical protein [Sphingorhabdus sp. SMR4y]ASK88364.1 hypothetical protein SPHFLASMR4Y_01616 [Sphingorhabdus sp. SMR4y]
MPSGICVNFEFNVPLAIAISPGEARVLHGKYIGLPNKEEADVYDLFKIDPDGEAVGECQGRIGATIVEVGPVEDR